MGTKLKLKNKNIFLSSISLAMFLVGKTSLAYASISAGGYIGNPGTVTSQNGIVNGTIFQLQSTNDPNQEHKFEGDPYEFVLDNANIINGSDSGGSLLHFNHESHDGVPYTTNNGYLYVLKSQDTSWIQALKGYTPFVQSNEWNSTFSEEYDSSATEKVSDLAQIVVESGASFKANDPLFGHTIYASNWPTAQIGLITSQVQQGSSLEWYNHAYIQSYHEDHHFEYVEILNSSGQDVTNQFFTYLPSSREGLAGSVAATQTASTINGAPMTEIEGGGGPAGQAPVTEQWVDGTTGSPGLDTVTVPSTLPAGTYTMKLIVKDFYDRQATSPAVTFTVTTPSTTPPPTGTCPTPTPPPPQPANTVESQSWSCNGYGDETLTWTDSNWVLQTNTSTDSNGCTITTYKWVDQPVTYSHSYSASVANFSITGLFYDPGTPTNPWYPWSPNNSQSNHDEYSNDSSQYGKASPTYGNPQAEPSIYVRVGGGFAFRVMWYGSPESMPSGGTVNYTITNPDGTTQTWPESFSLLPETEYNPGTYIDPNAGGYGYPDNASEYGYAYTPIPKYTTSDGLELAKWNTDGDPTSAAKISMTVQFSTPCGGIEWINPEVAQTFGVPVWYFNHEVPVPNSAFQQPQQTYQNNVFTAPGTTTQNTFPAP